jgi:NAD(P)-dependent dehydrogenase (short-subunit alcohol dehydrogenase family)
MNTAAIQSSPRLHALWRKAKRWRHLPLGPVRLTFKFSRAFVARDADGSSDAYTFHARSSQCEPEERTPQHTSVGLTQYSTEERKRVAVIVGVGPGFGEAVAMLLAQKGFHIALVSRSAAALRELASHLDSIGTKAVAFPCDVTDESAVMRLMHDIESAFGPPDLLIYAVQAFSPGTLLSTDAVAFEECWRGNCLGAFIVAREAAKVMCRVNRGTILFAGATSGTIGRKGYVNLAIGKFGLRALSQVIARELGPEGIHVAHVVIDGDISDRSDGEDGEDGAHINPRELAELFWMLHQQPKSCWSSEVDVRPSTETFWEHC